MPNDLWSIRLTDEKDRYEIVTPNGEIVDVVSVKELTEAENSHTLMRGRVQKAQRTYRVKRFAQLLEDSK